MAELLSIQNLSIRFPSEKPGIYAVKDLCLSVREGEIMGIVGESGSGKTVTALSVCGLLPKGTEVTGSITLDGWQIVGASEKQMRTHQGIDLAMVFQEPMTSLNPVMRIGAQVEECLRMHTALSAQERRKLALEALAQVELPEPETVYRKYPHELSGGQLQRVMIAAAIVGNPRLILADEPTTALDVSVQAQILELLKKLNREKGITILFISHNLKVVRKLCDRVAVMQNGRLVEAGTAEQIFCQPTQDYTKRLIAAIPTRDKKLI